MFGNCFNQSIDILGKSSSIKYIIFKNKCGSHMNGEVIKFNQPINMLFELLTHLIFDSPNVFFWTNKLFTT